MSTNNLLDILQQIDPDKSFGDEELQRLEKSAKEQKRIAKREKRVKDCGKWSNWYNPHSGKRTGFVFQCGLFRYCKNCLEKRADEEYDFMKQAALDKRMVVVLVDPKTATKMLRTAEKTQYVRYPQEDDLDMLILDESLGIEGREIDFAWVKGQSWTSIVNTPKGRNKSGTIHLPPSDENPDDFTIIHTQQFVTTANRNTTLRAMQIAEQETSDLDPQTPDEVVSALHRRIRIATNRLRQAGYTVNVYSKRMKLIHALIDWQDRKQINRVNTENPTRAIASKNMQIDCDVGTNI